jgi:hypothetical protein
MCAYSVVADRLTAAFHETYPQSHPADTPSTHTKRAPSLHPPQQTKHTLPLTPPPPRTPQHTHLAMSPQTTAPPPTPPCRQGTAADPCAALTAQDQHQTAPAQQQHQGQLGGGLQQVSCVLCEVLSHAHQPVRGTGSTACQHFRILVALLTVYSGVRAQRGHVPQ